MTILELEAYFSSADLPKTIMLNKATKVNNVADFVKTTLMRAKGWKGDPNRNPSQWHLQNLYNVLEKKSQS